jgi:ATP-dependent helicase/nuclease subunit B
MLHLLLSTDWTAERKEILRRIASDVASEQGGRILIVPELISHDTERRLCEAAGDTSSRYAEVLSFTRLARRVADSNHCSLPDCMDNGGRVVAMAAAARQLHSKLKAYAAVETKPEFLTELVDAVDECKRCCITARDLQIASGQTEGSLAQKLEELSLLLEGYDALCAQGKRDPRDQMNWLLEQLEDGNFGQEHVFYIDGFPDLTRQHLEILEHLIRVSPSVTVGLNCDAVDSEKLAFEKAGTTAKDLLRCARQAGVEVEIEIISGAETHLHAACNALFQGATPSLAEDAHLQILRTDSQWAEVEIAAQKVMELVRSGCRYRDISIVCTDMAAYADVINLVFHRCGIPVYQSGNEDILQKTVVSTVLSALDAALAGFEQADVVRYLRSVLSPLEPDLCDRVENYAIVWGVRGKAWENTWVNHPDGLGEKWTEATQGRLDRLNAARVRALEPLFHLNENFRQAKNLAEQTEALYAFLEEIRFADRLGRLADAMDAAGDNRSAQILNQLWEILLTALEQLHGVLGNTVWEPEVFTKLLVLLLSQYDVGTIPPVLDAVMAGPVSAMRCQESKHLILLGAEEGKLPGYGGAKGLLTDQERTALRALGVPLTGGAIEGLQAEFAEIYGVFCGAKESITVLCSAAQPSYVYRRLAEMAGGEQTVTPQPVAAMADTAEAGAWLARLGAADAARALKLETEYENIVRRASYDLGRIEKENVLALYGTKLNLSASQVDRQAECRLMYFLKYGMRAKERKETTIDPAEFGTYVHAVLENTARRVMELGGFHEVSLEQTMEIAMEYSKLYTQQRFSQIDSARIAYLFRRNQRELEMVVTELWQELRQAKFMPKDFELSFGDQGKMPAIQVPATGMEAALLGFVDRVDIWEENGNHYFRVVDYKTGKKDFDYCDVYNGVGLQMLLYLFALEQGGQEVVGENPIAAGVQYFPARAPLMSADGALTPEQAEKERLKEWKRRGLLLRDEQVLEAMDPDDTGRLCAGRKKDGSLAGDLADREQLKMLKSYIFSWLGNMVDDIAAGHVTPNPYTRGTAHNACSYCPYSAVCHKETVEGRRNYKAMEPQKFWEEVEKEVRRHG